MAIDGQSVDYRSDRQREPDAPSQWARGNLEAYSPCVIERDILPRLERGPVFQIGMRGFQILTASRNLKTDLD